MLRAQVLTIYPLHQQRTASSRIQRARVQHTSRTDCQDSEARATMPRWRPSSLAKRRLHLLSKGNRSIYHSNGTFRVILYFISTHPGINSQFYLLIENGVSLGIGQSRHRALFFSLLFPLVSKCQRLIRTEAAARNFFLFSAKLKSRQL